MPPPSEATTNLELILHHLLPLLLLSSLSVKAFVGRWHLLRSKLIHLQASLSQLSSSLASSSSPAASQEQNEKEEEEIENRNPLLRDHLLPNILSTLETIHSLSEKCRDHPPSGKLLMQSNLDIASSSLSLHLRHLDLLLNSGVLCSSSNAAASNNPTAIVLPQPGPSASRDELAFFVRDLFARLQIGGPDFKKKALESLLQLLRDVDDAESAKNSVVVATEGDVACLIHLLDSHGHPLFVREQAVHAISVLASASASDICIGTSAAPTYFPAHYFKTGDSSEGNVREFNLIDGGVAANNPALVAMSEVTREVFQENPNFFPIKPMDYGKFLVISLGTGTQKNEEKYSAKAAGKWGVFGWLVNSGNSPLVDVFSQASGDMVDIHLCVVFEALHSGCNYLRIQDDTLKGPVSSVDISTKENMENLVSIGEGLLKKPVSRVNIQTGKYEATTNEGTNEEALTRLAKLLSEERRLREAKSPHKKTPVSI